MKYQDIRSTYTSIIGESTRTLLNLADSAGTRNLFSDALKGFDDSVNYNVGDIAETIAKHQLDYIREL